ncbi:NAD(P)H-dependent oxidoreductase [Chloroflexus sp.]|uniref:NAD(P)H-dependent oxidoreductase n=1 Tax=Chloroflexus sp. TaxID=1904827 RepID=UPI00298F015C|nr:NAD(P)H-dependent oxidoreductase [Chloroflexus sp.]MDW8402740.1 NAD(P)H-dependent oxidoreductase [Chloroflexus sp.]
MKAVVLDGSAADDRCGQRVRQTLLDQCAAQGYVAQTFTLREGEIGNCAGDFFCWVRSPGQCVVADDNRAIAAAIVAAELLIYLTPMTFGGYSSLLKQAVDHQIQNIAPFFVTLNGETHHERRYDRYPNFLVIGWQGAPNPRAEAIFRHLVWRNSLNFYAPATHCTIVTGMPAEAELAAQMASALAAIARAEPMGVPELPELPDGTAHHTPPRNALLLVGSPRTRKSTSFALGEYLMQQLAAQGIATSTVFLHTTLNNPAKLQALLGQLATTDLIVLAFPLYIDTLPAPVIRFLEQLAARPRPPLPKRFVVIGNCGFPEARHLENALAICAEFAYAAGYDWQGGLALGGGEMVHGEPLAKLDGRAMPIRAALAIAAEALAQGHPIPAAAQERMNRTFIPAWLYRLVGSIGWRVEARRWGVHSELYRRPYQTE